MHLNPFWIISYKRTHDSLYVSLFCVILNLSVLFCDSSDHSVRLKHVNGNMVWELKKMKWLHVLQQFLMHKQVLWAVLMIYFLNNELFIDSCVSCSHISFHQAAFNSKINSCTSFFWRHWNYQHRHHNLSHCEIESFVSIHLKTWTSARPMPMVLSHWSFCVFMAQLNSSSWSIIHVIKTLHAFTARTRISFMMLSLGVALCLFFSFWIFHLNLMSFEKFLNELSTSMN